MASFKYLWINRTKPQWGSVNFFRAWAKRVLLIAEVLKRNSRRAALVRKGATISETAEIGEVKIEGAKSKLIIGDFSFLGRVYIALHGDVSIGKYVCINDGVEILTASHDIEDPQWQHIIKNVSIADYAWIGTGAMILPGVTIGKGAVVGARSVVTKSVPDGAVVAGNPAKVLSKKRAEQLNYNPCEFLAANQAWLVSK